MDDELTKPVISTETSLISQDEKITIGEKSLLIAPEIREQMKQLDEFVADRHIVAETFGWGLTVPEGENTERLIEFIAPEPDKVFVVDSLILDQNQRKLMDLLATSTKLTMTVSDQQVALIPDDSDDNDTWLTFQVGEKINWGGIKNNLSTLVGFELPDEHQSLSTEIRNKMDPKVNNGSTVELSLNTDWELIVSGGSAIITGKFIDRINILSQARNAKINFTMHHHPNMGLAVWALEGKSLQDRQEYYKKLLHFSAPDLQAMSGIGIDFFEIRALGTPENISSQSETTSRTYSFSEILNTSQKFGELVNTIASPHTEADTPEAIYEMTRQLAFEIGKLEGIDYPTGSLVRFYIGGDQFDKLKRELRDSRDRRSNKEVVLYYLVNLEDKHLPIFSPDLFQTREELNIAEFVNRLTGLYRQGGETKRKLDAFISDYQLYDLYSVDLLTESQRIREVVTRTNAFVESQLLTI